MTSAYEMRLFSAYSEINRNSTEIGNFAQFLGKTIAKHCHLSLTEVTMIRTKFLIVKKRAKAVFEVSFWYKANYWIFGVSRIHSNQR